MANSRGFVYAIAGTGVVIAVALLFPAQVNEKDAAKKTACLSNVKQIALATQLYAEDSNGWAPAAGPWMDLLWQYLKSPGDFACPNLRFPPTYEPKGSGYAFDKFLAGKELKALESPGLEPMIYETANINRNVWGYLTDMPNPGRHNGSNNFAFADGHVRSSRRQ